MSQQQMEQMEQKQKQKIFKKFNSKNMIALLDRKIRKKLKGKENVRMSNAAIIQLLLSFIQNLNETDFKAECIVQRVYESKSYMTEKEFSTFIKDVYDGKIDQKERNQELMDMCRAKYEDTMERIAYLVQSIYDEMYKCDHTNTMRFVQFYRRPRLQELIHSGYGTFMCSPLNSPQNQLSQYLCAMFFHLDEQIQFIQKKYKNDEKAKLVDALVELIVYLNNLSETIYNKQISSPDDNVPGFIQEFEQRAKQRSNQRKSKQRSNQRYNQKPRQDPRQDQKKSFNQEFPKQPFYQILLLKR